MDCAKQFNERSAGLLNRTQYPSDVIALVVLWRLRYKLSLRDLAEMFLIRGFVFSYEAVRDWEAKLTQALADELRRRRRGKVGPSWYVDETYIRVRGRWKYLYRAIDRDGGPCVRPVAARIGSASMGALDMARYGQKFKERIVARFVAAGEFAGGSGLTDGRDQCHNAGALVG